MSAGVEARDRALLDAYLATTWEVRLGDGAAELRVGHPAPLPSHLLPAGIVTAYNPRSEHRSLAGNREAQRRLHAELAGLARTILPVLARGTGPEAGLWDEPGFVVCAAPLEPLIALAHRFGQNAIVWVGPDGISRLLASRPGFCGRALGEPL